MKTIKCYAIVSGFDKGKEIYRQFKEKIYSQEKIDSYHLLVKWEVSEEEYDILYKAFHSDISKKIKLVE